MIVFIEMEDIPYFHKFVSIACQNFKSIIKPKPDE
jgi:hypothetical protein